MRASRWTDRAAGSRCAGRLLPAASAALAALAALAPKASASDRPQWGERHSRNMVSPETGLPREFDPATGRNVRWSSPLGTETYSSPVVARGRVFMGTNRARGGRPRLRGDRGVLLCLDERDGSLVWQLVVPKIEGDIYLDFPGAGLCSPPTVEGDRVYVVSNRAEVMCLDADGMADGNDGPYTDEGRHMAREGERPVEVAATDADIVWLFDMRERVGVYTHDTAHASILLDGPFLYLNTGNGVDNTHRRIRAPEAPSLIVLEKSEGRLVAKDAERIGPRVFHCTWSSPALGVVDGRRLVFYGGADGVLYAFEVLAHDLPAGPVRDLERVWRFDCDPDAPKEDVHRFVGNRREGPSTIHGMPVLCDGRLYVGAGGDIWWGKRRAWLKCVDPGGRGDITRTNELWSRELDRHSSSTPSVCDGLVFVADCGRTVRCLDAGTGRQYWTHKTKRDVWGSTLVADGRVYFGSRGGDFWALAASREKEVLGSVELGSAVVATPVAANGVLYVATMRRLYAAAAEGLAFRR